MDGLSLVDAASGVRRRGRDAFQRDRAVWQIWALVHTVGIAVLARATFYPRVDWDVLEYRGWAVSAHMGLVPYNDFRIEYPPGVLPLVALPGSRLAFEACFFALAFVADAVVLWLIRSLSRRAAPTALWLGAPVLIGPLLWCRLDVFVVAFLAGAVVAMRRGRWRTVGVCLAAASLLKLWPLFLVAVWWRLIPRDARRRVLGTIAAVAAVFVLPVLGLGGAGGLWWMLRDQGGRGLEIEAIPALPKVLHTLSGSGFAGFGNGSVEFSTPRITNLVVTVTLAVAFVAVAWLANRSGLTAAAGCVLLSAAMLVVGKVFSAQYIIWLVAVTAIWAAEPPGLKQPSRVLRTWVLTTAVIAAGLTQALFPWAWISLREGHVVGVTVAAMRDAFVVAWALVSVALARAEARTVDRLEGSAVDARVAVPPPRPPLTEAVMALWSRGTEKRWGRLLTSPPWRRRTTSRTA